MTKTISSGDNEITTPIEEYLNSDINVRIGNIISNCYLKLEEYKTSYYAGNYSTKYLISLYNMNGKYLNKSFKLSSKGLKDLMSIIQTNKLRKFSEVGILVLEEIARYKGGADIHYYLKVIINKPGEKPSIPKVKKMIPACKECGTMLLRFGFRWKIQKDDLPEKICPYCGKPLEIEKRPRKLIKVSLDFSEENCTVGDTRAQIGILYSDHSIKSTINPQGIFHYIQNYQYHFENNAIGPLTLKVQNGRPYYVTDIKSGIIVEPLEWRPAMLFPEDLVAI